MRIPKISTLAGNDKQTTRYSQKTIEACDRFGRYYGPSTVHQVLKLVAVYFDNVKNPLVWLVLVVGRRRQSNEEVREDSKEEIRKEEKEQEQEENGVVARDIACGSC